MKCAASLSAWHSEHMSTDSNAPTIAIVGPCASGKTSLAQGLLEHGVHARQVVQEHSYVPEMWQVIAKPDYLIYLNASFEVCSLRKTLNWSRSDYDEQQRRLAHAKDHCDLLVETDELSESAVLDEVLVALRDRSYLPE